MKKVLMIAYQFPPMGGAGVQRTAKFAKYLPLFDWEPIVFTRQEVKNHIQDPSLLEDVSKDLKIIRTKPYDMREWPGIFGLGGKWISRKLIYPDGERVWQFFNREVAKEVVAREKIDVIYTTSYPYSDHLLGLYLKKEFPHIPWVVDFRDEWTNNPYILDMNYSKIRMKKEKEMEKAVVENCDFFITNTPIMLQNFQKDYSVLTNKNSVVISNGYDEDDFNGLEREVPHNEKMIITYTGAMYGRRKPDSFFQALHELIKEEKVEEEKIEVRLIGEYVKKSMDEKIEKYGLGKVVKILPYMKHRDSIEKLLESDVLLLIIGAGRGAETFYTGKVFEYINTGRPILALAPEAGVAAALLKETQTGYVADSQDVPGIKQNIHILYEKWDEKKEMVHPNWEEIQQYERKMLTKRLAQVLDAALKDS